MKQKTLAVSLILLLCVGTASAQFGFGGVVYDPTNYHNALLRYFQLQQQLIQLKNSYAQLVSQYNLAVQMAKNLHNMPSRYRAQFSQWRNTVAEDTYGNTTTWLSGINSGQLPLINNGYRQATTQLLQYSPDHLTGMTSDELGRVKSQYASVELSDGANTNAIATIGSLGKGSDDVVVSIDDGAAGVRAAVTNYIYFKILPPAFSELVLGVGHLNPAHPNNGCQC